MTNSCNLPEGLRVFVSAKEVEPGGFHVQFSFVFKNGATEVASGVGADDGSVRGNACALEVIGGQRSGGNREDTHPLACRQHALHKGHLHER